MPERVGGDRRNSQQAGDAPVAAPLEDGEKHEQHQRIDEQLEQHEAERHEARQRLKRQPDDGDEQQHSVFIVSPSVHGLPCVPP